MTDISWTAAGLWSATILVAFILAVVLVPNWVLGLDAVSGWSDVVADAVILAVWGVLLGGLLTAVRKLQRRGWI